MDPDIGYQGEEMGTSLSTSPPQEAIEKTEVRPQPTFQIRQTLGQNGLGPFILETNKQEAILLRYVL